MTTSAVLVMGEALTDVLVTSGGEQSHPGGSPMNIAYGLSRLGRPAELHSYLSLDERGRGILAHVQSAGVTVLPDSLSAPRTSSAVARIGAGGEAVYDFDILWDPRECTPAEHHIALHVGSISAFIAPGRQRVRETVDAAYGRLPVFFDPNIRESVIEGQAVIGAQFTALVTRADVVKLSDEDAEWLFPDATVDEVLDKLLALGTQLAVVTRGANGAVLASHSARVACDSVRATVVDTIGAGDSFMACLIDAVLERGLQDFSETELADIGRLCTNAAAITVSRSGANPPTRAELDAALA